MLFTTVKIFNAAYLVGKAVLLKGDTEGVFLVGGADGAYLYLVNQKREEISITIEDIEHGSIGINVLELPQEQPKKTRVVEGRKQRTVEQAKKDSETLTDYLKCKGYPLKLDQIIKVMRSYGLKHWNNSNASSFMKQAIKHGAPIKKLERGVYVYEPQITVSLDFDKEVLAHDAFDRIGKEIKAKGVRS